MSFQRLINANSLAVAALVIFATFFAVSCNPDGSGNADGSGQSTMQGEGVTGEEGAVDGAESLDWSTVTPEALWTGVFQVYETDGPDFALILLDRGVENGVVTSLDAEQVRAGFLYELGRYDEAFLSLALYRIDATNPDLLKLRAEVLWAISRFDDASRDYEALLAASSEETPHETLYALARLYDDMGEWELAQSTRERIAAAGLHPLSMQLALSDAIQSEDPELIRRVGGQLVDPENAEESTTPIVVYARAYIDYIEGNHERAVETIKSYFTSEGFDISLESLLLKIYSEDGEFEAFETELQSSLDLLDSSGWLSTDPAMIPVMPENPAVVASILDSASALELGRGNTELARTYADRARSLDPYDHVAYLQLAAVEMALGNIPVSFEYLNEAVILAPVSDVRTRLRMIQFAPLITDADSAGQDEPLWDEAAVVSRLEENINHWESRFPSNAFYRSARAELNGYRGETGGAVEIYSRAVELPGVVRETFFRYGYWQARNGRVSDAWNVVADRLPQDSPFLTWAVAVYREAEARSDTSLGEFAGLLQNRLDSTGSHAGLFGPAEGE